MDKISVIVPVWNAHDYLGRCVESIIDQTYKNLEILLVDDGSSDDSLAICNRYAKKDTRIKVFHKENGGQASARNYALEYATGEYIGFVDNDDWIFPTMYERLHQLMVQYQADVGRCDDMQGVIEETVDKEKAQIRVTEAPQFFDLLYQDIWGGHVTDRLFRREVIGITRFPYSKTIEDMRFMREILPRIKREVSTNEKLFFYTIRENNTSKVYARTYINAYERAEEFQSRYCEALEKYPQYCDLLLCKATSFSCSAMKALLHEKKKNTAEFKKMHAFVKKYKKDILKQGGVHLKYKLFILVV